MAFRWYAVQTASGYNRKWDELSPDEQKERVAKQRSIANSVKLSLEKHLAALAANESLQKCIEKEIQVPTEKVIEIHCQRELRSYILIQMDMEAIDKEQTDDEGKPLALRNEIRAFIVSIPNVLGIGVTQRWYVVQAYSGYEKRVKRSLEERIVRARRELQKCFGQVLVPTEEVVEMREGQKRKSDRKLFPGYVLVQMDMEEVDGEQINDEGEPLAMRDEIWHFVKNVPKVLGFIGGTHERPTPISDKEAQIILQRVQDAAIKPRPKVLFEVGEVVRVIDGPFSDFNGVVEEVNYEKNRLRVAVRIFGRSTPVELEFIQVEKE